MIQQTYKALIILGFLLFLSGCTNPDRGGFVGIRLLSFPTNYSDVVSESRQDIVISQQRHNLDICKPGNQQITSSLHPEGLLIDQLDREGYVIIPVSFSSQSYNFIEITILSKMKQNEVRGQSTIVQKSENNSSRPDQLVLRWKTKADDDFHHSHEIVKNIRPSNQFETYRFYTGEHPLWQNWIDSLSISMTAGYTTIILSEIVVRNIKPEDKQLSTVKRVKLDSQSRAAILLKPDTFWEETIYLSNSMSLDFGAQALKMTSGENDTKARLIVSLRQGLGFKKVIFDKYFTPAHHNGLSEWQDYRVDLSTYSYQRVSLSWSVICTGQDQDQLYIALSQPFLYSSENRPPSPNIMLISLDTLRADHLGCYGYPKSVSPNVDWLAKQSTASWSGITPYPSTAPAHISMLTGLYPFQHSVYFRKQRLDPIMPTLAEYCLSRGYVTMAVTGGGNVSSYRRLDKGFLMYDESDRNICSLSNIAQPLIEKYREFPFFLFYHTYEIHSPYQRYEPFTDYLHPTYQGKYYDNVTLRGIVKDPPSQQDIKYIKALYDSGIRFTDRQLGILFQKLRSYDILDKTIIILLSDHGEHFGEHGLFDHGNSLYDPLVKVPLLFSHPGSIPQAQILHNPISLIDIPATVVGLVWGQRSFTDPGIDFSSNIKMGKSIDSGYCISELKKFTDAKKKYEIALVDDEYKFIYQYPDEIDTFFVLPSSEYEKREWSAREIEQRKRYREKLLQFIDRYHVEDMMFHSNSESDIPLDKETEQALQSLGYIE